MAALFPMETTMKLAMKSTAALGALALAATATQALAAPAPAKPQVTVDGSASPTCVLGPWTLASGPNGVFSAGTASGSFTYDSSVMVTGAGVSNFSGNSGKVAVRAPLICNTAMSWTVSVQKGALALNTPPSPVPSGFSTKWVYRLHAAPEDGSNNQVGLIAADYTTNGHPVPPNSFGSSGVLLVVWGFMRNFEIDVTPQAINGPNNKMIAGDYSESITLQVSPSV